MIDGKTTNKEYLELCLEVGTCQEGIDWLIAHEKDCPTFEEIYHHPEITTDWKIWQFKTLGHLWSEEYRLDSTEVVKKSVSEGNKTTMYLFFDTLDPETRFKFIESLDYMTCGQLYTEKHTLMTDEEQELCASKCINDVPHLILQEKCYE